MEPFGFQYPYKKLSHHVFLSWFSGQAGGANMPNGTPPQAAKMQMAANNIAQNLVNDFRVNIQDQEGQQQYSTEDQPVDQNDQQNRHEGGY